jgi:hypothetical protein
VDADPHTHAQASAHDAPPRETALVLAFTSNRKPGQTLDLSAEWPQLLDALHEGEWLGKLCQAMKLKVREVTDWILAEPSRVRAYDLALEMSAEALLQKATEALDGATVTTTAKASAQAHHFRWLASKRNAAKFGDKLDLTSGNKPLAPRTQAEIDAELLALANKAHKGNRA